MRTLATILISFSISSAACTRPTSHGDAATFEAPRDLSATLVDGQHVDLAWRHDATAPGGAFVEFKTSDDEEPFTMLDGVWRGTTGYRHPDVAPDTEFIYRVRSFFGRPSETVTVRTGRKGKADQDLVEGRLDGAGGIVVDPTKKSGSGFTPQAAPTHLVARPASGTSVELRWRDNARGEDGYLVEMAADPGGEYRIAAILPPDSTSFRKITLEEETRFQFRVRAFFYGPASNLVAVVTPPLATQDVMRKVLQRPGTDGG